MYLLLLVLLLICFIAREFFKKTKPSPLKLKQQQQDIPSSEEGSLIEKSSKQPEPANFIWPIVASFLSPQEIAQLSQCSKSISSSNLFNFFQYIYIPKSLDPNMLQILNSKLRKVKSLHLSGYRVSNKLVKECINLWQDSLENVYIKAYGISYDTAYFIIQQCPRLKTITLDKAAIFPEEIEKLAQMKKCKVVVQDRFEKCPEIESEIEQIMTTNHQIILYDSSSK